LIQFLFEAFMIRQTLLASLLTLTAGMALAQNAAIVNGKAIPSSKVDLIISELKKQGQQDSPQLREKIRDSLIMTEIFRQEAQKRKLLDRGDVKLSMEQAQSRIVMNALAQDFLKENPITDTDVKTEYEKMKEEVGKTTEYKARHILVEKEDEAKQILTKIKGGAKFEELAKQSKDPGSASNGGDLGWASADTYVPEFSSALQKLKKGELTDTPIKTQYGFHIIRLEDSRQGQIPPFEQVQPQIREQAQQRKLAGFQDQLRKAAKIQ
jgi:peptidyl-prolyl cis-trans isomerase C